MRLLALPLLLLTAACAGTPKESVVMAPEPIEAAPPPAPVAGGATGPGYNVDANTGEVPNSSTVSQQVANPNEAGFQNYLAVTRERFLAKGITPATWNAAFNGVHLNMKSIGLTSGASGGMGRISTYLERVEPLVSKGRGAVATNRAALEAAARTTGVDPMAIAGIWGNETGYGAVLGNFYVVEALASLAYEGRRRAFFEDELLAALTLLQQGLVTRAELTGSYAGALGQVQFMPSNILKLGMDGDGDGERDLRGSLPDAFTSCGNYLRSHGWRTGEPTIAEARLPANFRWEQAGPDIQLTAAQWDAMGVSTIDGKRLSSLVPADQPVSILLPAGYKGIPIIAFENYRRFLDYNPSQAYAISVAQLGNRLAGSSDFRQSWPADLRGMTAASVKEMQTYLLRLGYDVTADGRFGDKTRRAVRAYQLAEGLPADGYPTDALLARLRGEPVS
ncbi:Membrane-bound lytic murein transglycosylase B [Alphaproteobacteria bacterium SO-S41]|nr:Membrane-bound lytic murein transglycosylase B [Alphaproteobacteria bacterium SO-S41]